MSSQQFNLLLHEAIKSGFTALNMFSKEDDSTRVVQTHSKRSETRKIDLEIQNAILNTLNDYPVKVFSEELTEDNNVDAEYFVVLDPIDGTTNYAHGVPHFSICIAGGKCTNSGVFLDNIEIAIIADALGNTIFAHKGTGATRNGQIIKTSSSVAVQNSILRPTSIFSEADPLQNLEFASRLYLGCTSLELVLLAQGGIEVFLETKKRKIFDFAAAYLIVREAGGIITDLKGMSLNTLQISREATAQLLVSANASLHDQILSYLVPRL